MKNIKENFMVFSIGAVLYSLIEILFRGFTHWTMTITGGIAFSLIYIMNFKMKACSILKRCLAGCILITALEFVVGCIVNRQFHMNVWDYSDQKFNIFGQICPLFSAMWFFLCIPAIMLSKSIKKNLSKKLK